MKLEKNMYVRTPYGMDKIKDIVLNGNLYEDSGLYLEKGIKLVCGKEEMKNLKASHNIIDLIEEGDYVNDYPVYFLIDNQEPKMITTENGCLSEREIETIVTKEQFESMSYKVGD